METVSPQGNVSHRDIINREGGSAAVARKVSDYEVAADRPAVDANTVQAWKRTDSIPSPYWQAFVDTGLSSFRELAAAAAAKRAA